MPINYIKANEKSLVHNTTDKLNTLGHTSHEMFI